MSAGTGGRSGWGYTLASSVLLRPLPPIYFLPGASAAVTPFLGLVSGDCSVKLKL